MSQAALRGARVLVPVTPTRTDFARRLTDAGAHVAPAEFIAIAPTDDQAALDRAVTHWCQGDYPWLVVTSRNAVDALAATARSLGLSLAQPQPLAQVAAVGEGTRDQCEQAGLTVALIPHIRWDARALVDDFPAGPGRVLAPLGNLAAPVLADGLTAKGWDVDTVQAYRTVDGAGLDPQVRAELAAGGFDAVVLTSGSVAQQLVASVAELPAHTQVVAIGQTTAAAARAGGIHVNAIAAQASYDGVAASLVKVLESAREVSP